MKIKIYRNPGETLPVDLQHMYSMSKLNKPLGPHPGFEELAWSCLLVTMGLEPSTIIRVVLEQADMVVGEILAPEGRAMLGASAYIDGNWMKHTTWSLKGSLSKIFTDFGARYAPIN